MAITRASRKMAFQPSKSCPLLDLPRELRDMIWRDVFAGNVLHVSRNHSNERHKFQYHICDSPRPWSSSACPPGTADHKECCSSTSKKFDASSILVVCKQIKDEISTLHMNNSFFSQNAFQFADLELATEFIFGLAEEDRAAISELRLALPYLLDRNPQSSTFNYHDAFKYFMNYYSFRFGRESLDIRNDDWLPENARRSYAKAQIQFYYSDCYYKQNTDRMGKRWQVSFKCTPHGTISWDIGISDLKEKKRPKIGLAMLFPEISEEDLNADFNIDGLQTEREEFEHMADGENELRRWPFWILPLLQFKQYADLDLRFYGETDKELKEDAKLEEFTSLLKEQLQQPKIGPHPCVFFNNHW